LTTVPNVNNEKDSSLVLFFMRPLTVIPVVFLNLGQGVNQCICPFNVSNIRWVDLLINKNPV